MALGGHLSLTSSAVAAIGSPFSDVVLEGWEGTVPGIGVGWTTVDSTLLWTGLISVFVGVSLLSDWEDVARMKYRKIYTIQN